MSKTTDNPFAPGGHLHGAISHNDYLDEIEPGKTTDTKDPILYEQTVYGKPTGCFVVVHKGQEVVFRRHAGERKATVRKRAQAWIDSGCEGIPGTARPKRPIGRS